MRKKESPKWLQRLRKRREAYGPDFWMSFDQSGMALGQILGYGRGVCDKGFDHNAQRCPFHQPTWRVF